MPDNVPETYTDYLAAARQLQQLNRDSLLAVLDGLRLDAGERHVVNLLAELHSDTVVSALRLLERCRKPAGWYTGRLHLPAVSIDADGGWQVLDARDETTWHAVRDVDECRDETCANNHNPAATCIVVRSAAFSAGLAHLESDELLTVRIPAGEPAAAPLSEVAARVEWCEVHQAQLDSCLGGPKTPCAPRFYNDQIGERTGYVAGDCGHAVALSEWRTGFRRCERCIPAGGL